MPLYAMKRGSDLGPRQSRDSTHSPDDYVVGGAARPRWSKPEEIREAGIFGHLVQVATLPGLQRADPVPGGQVGEGLSHFDR
jgi:hypothetical protein